MKPSKPIMKTIVIDDSKLQRDLTTMLVEKHPFLDLVGSYPSPEDGLKVIGRQEVDLILLDVEMPNMNGFEMLELIDGDAYVIMNSTVSDFALRAFDHGVVDFLLKPMRKNRFRASIERVICKWREKNKLQGGYPPFYAKEYLEMSGCH